MELHQLRYALAVRKHKSFTRAAEEIPVSVASVSEAVKQLETELGVALFTRTSRTVRLTVVGAIFLEHAAVAVEELDLAQRQLDGYRGTRKSVALGTPPSVFIRNLSLFLARFQRAQPLIEVKLVEAPTRQLVQALRSGEVDISFLTGPQGYLPADLEGSELERQEVGIAVAPGHPLAASDLIDLSSLGDMQMVALPDGFAMREIADEICRRAALRPKIAFETSVPEMLFGLVRAGAGFTFLGRARALQKGLAFVRCTPRPLDRLLTLAWVRSRSLSAETGLLRDQILQTKGWLVR